MIVALGLLVSLQRLVPAAAKDDSPIQCLLKRTSCLHQSFAFLENEYVGNWPMVFRNYKFPPNGMPSFRNRISISVLQVRIHSSVINYLYLNLLKEEAFR